eukprot:5870421-Pyramimonas_sp.AAC.1
MAHPGGTRGGCDIGSFCLLRAHVIHASVRDIHDACMRTHISPNGLHKLRGAHTEHCSRETWISPSLLTGVMAGAFSTDHPSRTVYLHHSLPFQFQFQLAPRPTGVYTYHTVPARGCKWGAAPGICSLVPYDWFQPLEYALWSPGDLSMVTAAVFYGSRAACKELAPFLSERLKPGTLVVSVQFEFPW